ncbi:hypothetical protein EXM22_12090 [Oceanispirochaeta crateris]|uniref:Tetratricopeptide repeat protein n=1 Tax=Oceanispirochaeta crateris TaxID=2518645 RepID=A0A5C1QRI3_9SPIO|nr:transglutaminase family protein [Oceanispirochaeta crateris]QEN08692.1 hypothetical protein EXM22_12090 [Oceanispirochaeta crateris]
MKKVYFFFFFSCLILASLTADAPFTLLTQPTLLVPLGPSTEQDTGFFSLGGGALLEGEFNFDNLNYLHFGPQLEYDILPIKEGSTSLNLFNFGVNAGVKLTPFPRSVLRIWAGGGGSYAMYEGISTLFPYYVGGTDITFRLSPAVNLGLGAKYIQGESSAGTVYQTVGLSLGLGYNFQVGNRGAELQFNPNTHEIYPLYYTWYDENPLGELKIINNSSEKISNIRTSFFVPQYMEQPKYSDEIIATMLKGETSTVSLQGLFTNQIFEINEGLKVAGEVKVEYLYYGKEYSKSIPLTVHINNKNAMTWDDDRKAASFVTANNPLVYSYSRSLSGRIRNEAISSLDKNFQIGMGLFESLNLYGLGYVVDPSSAYVELSEDQTAVDYIQFPQQTLISQGGDCDDLSVLYASMLEASGIPAAFITIPGHIYVAYQLDMKEHEARRRFPGANDLLFINDNVWLPVEVTLVDSGFLLSWQTGARQIRENKGQYEFYPVREAWQTYPAAEFESSGIAYLPAPAEVLEQHNRELKRFLRQELSTQLAMIEQQISKEGKSHILYNKMGVTYARYGFLDEALTWFQRVVDEQDFYPSLINLGNIFYLQKNASEASRYYARALNAKPNSEKALTGLAMVSSELEDYNTANSALATLAAINPEAAQGLMHLGTVGAARASSAQNREVDEWTEE